MPMMTVAPLASPGPLDLLFRRRSSLGLSAALNVGGPATPTPWDMLQRRRSSLGLSSLFDERAVPNGPGGGGGGGGGRASGQWAARLFEQIGESDGFHSGNSGGSPSPAQLVPSEEGEHHHLMPHPGQPLLEALISDPMFMSGQSLLSKPTLVVTSTPPADASLRNEESAPPSSPGAGLSVKIEPFNGPMLAPSSSSYTPDASPDPAGLTALSRSDRKRRFDHFNEEDEDEEDEEVEDDDDDDDEMGDLNDLNDAAASEDASSGSESDDAPAPESPQASGASEAPPKGPKGPKRRRRVPTSAAVRAAMPKPPRRGRKDKSIEERCKGMSPEQARLEKNRQSAKECRLRKKEYVGNLEQKVAEFEEREQLRSKELDAVRAQLKALQRQYDAIRA